MSRNLLNINDNSNYAECIQTNTISTNITSTNLQSNTNNVTSLNITNNSSNPIGIELKNGNSNTWGIKTAQNKLYVRNENLKKKDIITINNDGKIGIGVISPVNTLDISGSVVIGTNYASKTIAPQNGLMVQGTTVLSNLTINNLNNLNGSFLLNYNPTNGIVNYQPNGMISDKRFKINISDANTNKYLDLVNTIKSKEFNYIDNIINKNKWGVGVIADEINEIEFFKNNELIGYQTGYIPNIYKSCNIVLIKNIVNNWQLIKIFLDNVTYKLQINDSIMYIHNNCMYQADIVEFNNYYISIKNNHTEDMTNISKLFIYGSRVTNIKYIKNDCLIWTLIPAIQELSKENNKINDKYNELDDKYNKLDDKYNQLDDKYNKLDDKYNQLDDKYNQLNEQFKKMLNILDITS
jgi:hypothetical protein